LPLFLLSWSHNPSALEVAMSKRTILKPLLMLSLLLIFMLACGSAVPEPVAEEPAATATAAQAEVQPTQTEEPTPTPQPAGTSPENPVSFSETVVTAGWEITVLQYARGEEALALLRQASPFNQAHPDPSMEYALVNVHVKWTGEGTNRVDGTFFSGMDSAMVNYDRVGVRDARAPSPSISGFDDLATGDEVEGWTVIQIGNDASGVILVVWPRDNGMILGEETIRYIALEP
jgi:hypothetical protein